MLGVSDRWTLIAFVLVTIPLAPIAEEALSRRMLIRLHPCALLLGSTLLSAALFALEDSTIPLEFAQVCLWTPPLTFAYVRTRNV